MRILRPRDENSVTKGTHLSPLPSWSFVILHQNNRVVVETRVVMRHPHLIIISSSPEPNTGPDPGKGPKSVC